MSIFNLHIHEVDHVSIDTERETFDTGAGQTIHRIDIHATDHDGKHVDYRLTLYGPRVLLGSKDVPIEFSNREDEPPPAIKLAMERDLDGAVRYGKVFGEFLDSMLSPKRS